MRLLLAACAAAVLSSTAAAQEPSAPLPGPPAAPGAAPERPGLLKAGPFYLNPRINLGTVGLDTNVFYTATDRRTDFNASGGPGLEVILPMGGFQLVTSGDVDYVFFLRTESQRKLGGAARGALRWDRGRLRAEASHTYARQFRRPSEEVDERLLTNTQTSRLQAVLRLIGGVSLLTAVSYRETEVPEPAEFRGADLERTLTDEVLRYEAGLRFPLTPKTAFLLGGDYQEDRFPRAADRNADSNRAYGGFEISSQTRLFGRAVGGVRSFRLRRPGVQDRLEPYTAVRAGWRFGPRTALTFDWDRDLAFTAFDDVSGRPVLRTQRFGARLEKGLPGRIELDVYGSLTRLRGDGAVFFTTDEGTVLTLVRDDETWTGGADLGYRFRERLRIGVAVTYVERRSTIADLGLEGVLVGATVRFNPN